MRTFDLWFAFCALCMILVLGFFIFLGVKGCEYATSGNVGKDIGSFVGEIDKAANKVHEKKE